MSDFKVAYVNFCVSRYKVAEQSESALLASTFPDHSPKSQRMLGDTARASADRNQGGILRAKNVFYARVFSMS